ncbi:hypothetical protein ORV05_16635 [Amycolatopsis cynarae]|uniref:Secreted protein n=1 Tax=Amycolatopsis cynarae TaxID=2995223 RepID=A0ABY7BAE7_9PSEU|nr:hypothetical protein [Amycolatopsis sp. HUAS 11-8]WAL69326.1 hypothetical protein ORV05_16635 [Amycolatopsis sp. HUAS 11-8]
MGIRGFRGALVALAGALVLSVCGAVPAFADGAPSGSDLSVAQTLGDRELTVVIRRAEPVPGPLRVEVVSHAGGAPGVLNLRATATQGKGSSSASLTLGGVPGSYAATLGVDQPGPWELSVDDGQEVARIPFLVPARVVAPWERAAYGGFVAAGALLLVALAAAVRARRSWIALVPGAAMVAALSVAVTAALLSAGTPQPPQPGSQLDPTVDTVTDPYRVLSTTDFSRPPVTLSVAGDAAAGRAVDLDLAFSDAATGRPVDDLLVRDDALVHLVVVGPSGQLWHLHPYRVAAGGYRVRLRPPEPGEYALAAEVARRGGGVQLVRSALEVRAGVPAPSPETTAATVRTVVEGAGSPSTITARLAEAGDLQPWLGMLGHLIVVGPLPEGAPVSAAALSAPVWGHAHAMLPPLPGPAGGPPDETVAAYGPDLSFTYTFPLPGRYRLWIQAERGFSVRTVPVTIDVPMKGAGG